MNTYTLEIYEDVAHEWRWRIVHRNGKVIADGGEGYATRSSAIRAARRLRLIAWTARLSAE
jgi:uncharacterized protein YegP (UPF0339 family)